MKISVVMPALVLNWDLRDQMREAVESVKGEDIELIIVDNGSMLDTAFMVENADIYISYPEKIGFGPACNAGLKLATGDYLAITSIDVKFLVGGFKELAEEFSKIPSIGVICPTAKNKGQTLDGMLYQSENEGSAFLISREVYDRVKLPEGLYDKIYEQGYFEDTDLWYRMAQVGLDQYRSGNVFIDHKEGTTQKVLGNRDEIFKKNKQNFIDKWGEEPTWRG